jgi:hypothetical protein
MESASGSLDGVRNCAIVLLEVAVMLDPGSRTKFSVIVKKVGTSDDTSRR